MGILDFFARKSPKSDVSEIVNNALLQTSPYIAPQKQEPRTTSEISDADTILLEYCTYGSYPNPKNGYPQMWEREFHITDVDYALQSLEERGYIRLSTALETLPKLTIPQLKALAVKCGVVVKGKKADILNELYRIPADILERFVDERKYRLTEKGEQTLKSNEHIVYVFKNTFTGISIERMKELVRNEPERPYRDLIWTEFNRRCYYMTLNGLTSVGEYRNTHLAMYFFLKQEQKYKTALVHLHEVFFLDLNDSIAPFIAPRIVDEAKEVIKKTGYTKDEFFESAQRIMLGAYAPHKNFEDMDVAGIFTALSYESYEVVYRILASCPDASNRSKYDSEQKTTAETLIDQVHRIAGDL